MKFSKRLTLFSKSLHLSNGINKYKCIKYLLYIRYGSFHTNVNCHFKWNTAFKPMYRLNKLQVIHDTYYVHYTILKFYQNIFTELTASISRCEKNEVAYRLLKTRTSRTTISEFYKKLKCNEYIIYVCIRLRTRQPRISRLAFHTVIVY